MSRSLPVRVALVALVLPTVVTLASCGHSRSTSSSSGSTSSSRTTTSSSSSSASSSGNCAAGFTPGKIGGQAKCLQPGQPCQQENASDYKKYGFECTRKNGRYELQKK